MFGGLAHAGALRHLDEDPQLTKGDVHGGGGGQFDCSAIA
jgi:hypothetical protein